MNLLSIAEFIMPTNCNMHLGPEALSPCQKCILHHILITAEHRKQLVDNVLIKA